MSANYTRSLIRSDSLHSVLVAQNFPNGTVDGLPEGIPADSYNLRLDWAVAGTPPRHNLTGVVNARLPLGVFLTGTLNATTGRPYTILAGKDDNQDNSINDRRPANRAAAGRGRSICPSISAYRKRSSWRRRRRAAERYAANVNIFTNMTNAFNRPSYNPPSGVMTSPNFGRSTSGGNPREIEVGLRFQF